jgi:ABC-type Zn uptake system ZnuABC Zn-binding protein ZnuA
MKSKVKTIAEKLSELFPENQKLFEENRDRYLVELDRKIQEWTLKLAPWKGKPIVVYHNSWPYLADFAGLEIAGFVEPKPGIPPTARHIQELSGIMKEKMIKVIIKETFFENKTPRKLSEQTGAVVLNLPIGVGETKEARDYLSMIDSIVTQITQAFEKEASHD